MRIHCSIIEDCSQPFYFSKHTKEKANEARASTKHEEVTENGRRRKARKTGFPLLCQDSRFALASKISGDSIRALNVEIKTRKYRGLRTCLQYLFQPSLQTRRHDSFLSLHPLCFKNLPPLLVICGLQKAS